jgi:ribosome maturation factor RimP
MAAQQGGAPSADAVRTVVGPVVDDAGLYLEDVAVSGAGGRSVVRITVDLPEDAVGSLDSDTLGEVSRALSAALDADDVVPGAYTLEISTPGTSRALTELRHFRRARTRLVTLRLLDGGTAHGRLVDVLTDGQDGPVLLLDDGARVPLADVRKGKVEVELKRIEDEAGEDAVHDEDDDEGYDDEDAGAARTDEEA